MCKMLFWRSGMALFAAGLVSLAFADALRVGGRINSSAGGPIAGAVVSVTVGTGQAVSDTTDASGGYAVNTVTDTGTFGISLVMVSARATGYADGVTYGIVQSPADGRADTLTCNLTLQSQGGVTPQGDSLYVAGKVTAAGGAAIAGATVTLYLGWGAAGTESVRATTNQSGDYSIAAVNSRRRQSVTIAVSADGYQGAQQTADIAQPGDGTADKVTQNFTLDAVPYDTVIVTASVLNAADDSPLAGARVIVSQSNWTGTGIAAVNDTGSSNASGAVSFALRVPQGQNIRGFNWTVERDGFQSEEGTDAVQNDTLKIGTVRLTAYTTSDRVTYRVSGRIDDSNGSGVQGAQVIVVLEQAGSEIFRDTVSSTSFWGNYTAQTQEQYAAADITVTVSVSADGYNPNSVSKTVPSSTGDISIDVTLVDEGTAIAYRPAHVQPLQNTTASVYSITGRYLGKVEIGPHGAAALNAFAAKSGHAIQPLVVIRRAGGAVVEKTVIARVR